MNRPAIKGLARGCRMSAALMMLVLASGCGVIGPQAWQKDLMARKEMLLSANASVKAAENHIYFSKEGASGGSSAAGGGCGCN